MPLTVLLSLLFYVGAVEELSVSMLQAQVRSQQQILERLEKQMATLERKICNATAPPNNWGYTNVMDTGAKGDGVTDDTAAFQRALDDTGNAGGGPVFVPAGTYNIAGTLKIPSNTVLKGSNEYPFRSWGDASSAVGTTLLAWAGKDDPGSAPFISMRGPNSGVVGLNIFYPEQLKTLPVPNKYPATLQGSGDDLTVKNLLLVNSYIGIDFATFPCGRHLIEGIYGQPIAIGIQIDQCYDIGRIKSIHFWPFWADPQSPAFQWLTNNGVSLDLLRTDWEIVEDVFSFGYSIGLRFRASSNGACNGQFTDINFDGVDVGVDVYSTQEPGVFFSNLNLANDGYAPNRIGIRGNTGGNGMVSVRGASFWGDFNQMVVWDAAGLFSMSDSMMHLWNKNLPAIQITGGRAMIMGNYFHDVIGVAVAISNRTDRVLVTSNELVGNTLVNNGTNTLIADNHP